MDSSPLTASKCQTGAVEAKPVNKKRTARTADSGLGVGWIREAIHHFQPDASLASQHGGLSLRAEPTLLALLVTHFQF